MTVAFRSIQSGDMVGLHAYIESKLPPKDLEKKQFGEVFTPLTLVTEMLDAIDKYADKDFWKNPDLKILDPAAGIGNFPLVAYEKLMVGLKGKIPQEAMRKKHILENMLYMVELNGNNVRLMKKIFGGDKYKLNIVKGDFLEDKTHKKLLDKLGTKELKFDLVMGNPPFSKSTSRDSSATSTGKIWQDFVTIGISFLCKEGYLTMISPQSWRQTIADSGGRSKDYITMRSKQILYLSMYDATQSKNIFQVPMDFDWYVIKNVRPSLRTYVRDTEDKTYKVSLDKLPFLPSKHWDVICKYLTIDEDCVDLIYDRTAFGSDKKYVVRESSDEYKYPIVHVITSRATTLLWTNKENKVSKGKHMFGVSKVIITKSSGNKIENVIIDRKGKYGLSQNVFAFAIDETTSNETLKEFLLGPMFLNIIQATKGGGMFIDHRIFKNFKKNFWNISEDRLDSKVCAF